MAAVRRHDRVWLHAGAAFALPVRATDPALERRVADWIARGLPLVGARRDGPSGTIALGLSLPLADGRRRLGCQVAPLAVRSVLPPLPLAEALAALPGPLAAPLSRLADRLATVGIRVGVYGSLAWECLTGFSYRHARSDVDLVCEIERREQLHICLRELVASAALLPCALDGEIRFPGGRAVAWRELAAARHDGDRVLAKSDETVQLVSVAELSGELAEAPTPPAPPGRERAPYRASRRSTAREPGHA